MCETPLREVTNPETRDEFRGLLQNCDYQILSEARMTLARSAVSSSGFETDIDVSVNVRVASEVPDERRTFDSPDVPDFVALQVAV